MLDERDELNQELQRKQKALNKMMREKNEIEMENEELKKRTKRLTSGIQVEDIFKTVFHLGHTFILDGWLDGGLTTFDRH